MDPEISYQAFKRTAAADYAAVVNAKCEAEQLRIQKIEDYIERQDEAAKAMNNYIDEMFKMYYIQGFKAGRDSVYEEQAKENRFGL